MKAVYICDKKRGCRSCGDPWNECRHTADAKHAQNKDKRERYFVIYPNSRHMVECETLQEMEKQAQAVIDEWGDKDSADWVPDILRKMDETPTIDNTDAYVRGYNAGVQMSIKLFLSLGGQKDESIQM